MKFKTFSIIALFSASAALTAGFVIKTLIDHRYYTHTVNSAPFELQLAVNALGLIFPAVILAAVALFLLRKTLILWICCGVFAGIAVISAFIYGSFPDNSLYAVPAALSAVVCGIFAVISFFLKKRLTKA